MLGYLVSCAKSKQTQQATVGFVLKELNQGSHSNWESADLRAVYFHPWRHAAVFVMTSSIVHSVPGVFKTHVPPLFNVRTPTCPLLTLGAVSKRKPVVFLPFVFGSHITQFTRKYGLSCPFSMPGPQTNLPRALIWKMSLLSQGNRIILNDGNRGKSHQLWEKGHSYIWGRQFGRGVAYTGISRAWLIQLSVFCHANRAQGFSMEMR